MRRTRPRHNDEEELPPWFAPPSAKQQRREPSPPPPPVPRQQAREPPPPPPPSVHRQQQQAPRRDVRKEVTAEAPIEQPDLKKGSFRFSPPRKGPGPDTVRDYLTGAPVKKPVPYAVQAPVRVIQQQSSAASSIATAKDSADVPPPFEPRTREKKVAATTEQEEKEQVHWKDVHGLKIEEILKLDKQVRRCRFKPAAALLEKIEYSLSKFMEEQYFSTRELAEALYKGGVKSIWITSESGSLGFMQEADYVRGHESIAAAFDARQLPTNDGSQPVKNVMAIEHDDPALSKQVRGAHRLPSPPPQ